MKKKCKNCAQEQSIRNLECVCCAYGGDYSAFIPKKITNRQWLDDLSNEEYAQETVREHLLEDGSRAWFTIIWTGKICYPTKEEAMQALIKTLQSEYEG